MDRSPVAQTPAFGELEQHRRELTAHCYRMLGSSLDAEDAVQETLVRAWKNLEGLRGPRGVRSWLVPIATNVCLDSCKGSERRARPMDLGPRSEPVDREPARTPEVPWLQPMPGLRSSRRPGRDARRAYTIRLAFVAALQHLPAAPVSPC